MAGKKLKKVVRDTTDFALSILPELSGILTPEIVTQPELVTTKVLSAVVANKLRKFYSEFQDRRRKGEVKEDLESIQDSFSDVLNLLMKITKMKKLKPLRKYFLDQFLPTQIILNKNYCLS